MKTVIIGGSAQSTPALFDTDFTMEAPRFSFELVGRSPDRLAAITRSIGVIAQNRGIAIDCGPSRARTTAEAVADADVVLVQFRIGGYDARAYDETFPHRYGVCGDEGLGPGGFASAWRTWGDLREVLTAVERANKNAIVVLLTSPIGILTRCARDAFPALRIYGICELPWTTLGDLCAGVGADVHAASYAYIAVNHLGWFSDLRAGETTILWREQVHPLKYVRLQDARAEMLAEQRVRTPRGRELADLASDAYAIYQTGDAANVLETVRRRKTPWYAQAVAPFLRSLAGDDTRITYFLSATNDGYCSRFGNDEIIEMPFVARDGKLQRLPTATWERDDIAVTVARLIRYERLAAQAVISYDKGKVATALRAHPWLDGIAVTDRLVADVTPSAAAFAVSTR